MSGTEPFALSLSKGFVPMGETQGFDKLPPVAGRQPEPNL